ncbi:MAG TPA: S53 family peptidase [Candidatus Acidoferrales bacterium]|nr:S53 family peptidase [Candidatus Acidoferrales bacterium]
MKSASFAALLTGAAVASLAACAGPQSSSTFVPASQPAAASAVPSNAVQAAAQSPAVRGASGDVVATAAMGLGSGYRDFGRAPAGARLRLGLILRYRDEPGLERFIAEQRASGAPRWLTNAEFDERYAPSAQTYAIVARSLRAAGLHVEQTYANRTVIDASGTVAAVERYFNTEIHQVAQPGYGRRFVNVRPAYAPAALRGMVLALDGLDSRVLMQTQYARLSRGERPMAVAAKQSGQLFGPVSTQTGADGYAPLAFQKGYDFPSAHASNGKTYDGTGRAIAIAIDADFLNNDLSGFLKYFGIKRTGPQPQRVLIDFGPPASGSSSDSVEATLDVETTAANAPGASIYVYEMPELANNYIADTYNKILSDNFADVASSSFGGCETFVGKSAAIGFNALAEQGVAKGMTFAASTGDSGGDLCPSAPATSPNFTAVGGTTLTVGPGGAWDNETGWDGSGGGISAIFSVPAWQRGYSNVDDRGRNIPDVALDADPATGTAFYYEGSWNSQLNPLGGTSLSSPLFAAAVAQADQVKNQRVLIDSSKLFGLVKGHGYGTKAKPFFHDIVQGGDPYFAGPGYDLVTGIGSPDVWNLTGLL